MKLLKSTLMASALILGTASMAVAQNTSYGSGTQAKDMAVDKAKEMATDKAKEMVGDKAGAMVDPAMKAGEHMMNGDSAKDAAMAVAKDKAKDAMMGKGEGTVKDQMMHQGTIKTSAPSYGSGTPAPTQSYGSGTPAPAQSYGSGTAAPAPAPSINCPYGTTAQANGTCMITGDYRPRG